MTKHFILLLILMSMSVEGFGQSRYDQLSLEAGGGISNAYVNATPDSESGIKSKPHLSAGIRYMFDQVWGIRGQVAYDNFEVSDKVGTQTYRFDTQAVFNVGQLMQLPAATDYRFGLLMHAGAGITFLKANQPAGSKDKMISLVGGISPIFRITDDISVFIDGSLVMDMMRNVHYNGQPAAGSGSIKAMHATISAGIIIPIGSRERHSDWY